MPISAIDTLELPIGDRIRLVAEIWESIAVAPDAIQLTEETRQLLARRLEAHRTNPAMGSPWSEVKKRILSK
jgi:putative addiction module component (TIGR02574 family)